MANPFTIMSSTLLLTVLLCVSAPTRTKASVDDDICKTMVETQGYTCQQHQVTTTDGYVLGLQRIPAGRKSGNETGANVPVLLQHGVLMDGSAWLLNSPDKALAFILADHGFDVWLANTRGTKPSRGHTSHAPNDSAYWDWSWDELTAYDLPASFQYVNNQTGQSLHYVGHSLGTLTALAALSQGKLLNLLRSAALLSPIAYLGPVMDSLLARTFVDINLAQGLTLMGTREFPNELVEQQVQFICTTPGIDCSNFLPLITGPNCCVSSSSTAAFFSRSPEFTSTKNALHLFQMVRKGDVEMYDYGVEATNMEHYKQPTPPTYSMSNISKDVPLFLAYGGRDSLSTVFGVNVLLDDLKDHDKGKLAVVYREEYAHLDFVMADNASQLVYDPLLSFFKLH